MKFILKENYVLNESNARFVLTEDEFDAFGEDPFMSEFEDAEITADGVLEKLPRLKTAVKSAWDHVQKLYGTSTF